MLLSIHAPNGTDPGKHTRTQQPTHTRCVRSLCKHDCRCIIKRGAQMPRLKQEIVPGEDDSSGERVFHMTRSCDGVNGASTIRRPPCPHDNDMLKAIHPLARSLRFPLHDNTITQVQMNMQMCGNTHMQNTHTHTHQDNAPWNRCFSAAYIACSQLQQTRCCGEGCFIFSC